MGNLFEDLFIIHNIEVAISNSNQWLVVDAPRSGAEIFQFVSFVIYENVSSSM